MSTNSDHKKPRTNILNLLPEVYRSDVNQSIFEGSFNKHLTKDDTVRVAGFIGEGNPAAIVNRQIQEPTPHRQAYQLEPVMHTKISTVDYTLTQQGFLKQLELMGVDIGRLPLWANTEVFNWIPPVNIDMLVNFADYYWEPVIPGEPPQYFTIENRCNKITSRVSSYDNVIRQKGEIFPIQTINVGENSFTIPGNLIDVFVSGFVFFTKNTTNPNLISSFWTVSESSYESLDDLTTIVVVEDIAIRQPPPAPTSSTVGRWWYDTDNDILYSWSGTAWELAPSTVIADVSLTELRDVFAQEANCACAGDSGWDTSQFDDNQLGSVLWNQALLVEISHPTEADWILANGAPSALDLWFDITSDTLYQRDPTNTMWVIISNNFSTITSQTTGLNRWDDTLGCIPQELNQWSGQNRWIHKSEITSYDGIFRAQVPILEYNSTIELNQWSEVSYSWKYRSEDGGEFTPTESAPTRLELEPVKGFRAKNISGLWYIYLFESDKTINRDVNYSNIFTPGTLFKIVDDTAAFAVYTVSTTEHRITTSVDALDVDIAIPEGYMVTIIGIEEPIYSSPTNSSVNNARIEPVVTSMGDVWKGYHAHWVLDVDNVTESASAPRGSNYILKLSLADDSLVPVALPGIGEQVVGVAHQEVTISQPGVSAVPIDTTLQFTAGVSTYFATPGSADIRVYVDGIRQYGNYTETSVSAAPNYTMVGDSALSVGSVPYITEITFDQPLPIFSVVRIEIAPASYDDMGMIAVPVRTVEDETLFAQGIMLGTQPEYRSLSRFKRVEQTKNQLNQYPLFSMYDICTNELIDATPLFKYQESASQPINPNVQRRIVTSAIGREYEFEQLLLKNDDDQMYSYRNYTIFDTTVGDIYWYSPMNNTVQFWDGLTWISYVVIDGVQHILVSLEEEPQTPVLNDIWFDTTHQILNQYNGSSWIEIDVIIQDIDPTFQTIWRHGINNDEYVPMYVDKDRNEVPVGDVNGDWEMLHQWFNNPAHYNRKHVKYSELVTHIQSVLAAQPKLPGLLSGGVYTQTQNAYNYGVGGNIHEHNDNFDLLISAVNLTTATPISVIEFAEDQYSSSLLSIRESLNRNLRTLFSDISTQSILNQGEVITDFLIEEYKRNDFVTNVYGDTTSYNTQLEIGVPNWIASVPNFGLGELFVPHLIKETGFVELTHHDGHRTVISFTPIEEDRFTRDVISLDDTRVTGSKLGHQDVVGPTSIDTTFVSVFGGSSLRTGVYWYHNSGSVRQLYRFEPYHIGGIDPSIFVNGIEISDGTLYYNSLTRTTHEKQGATWVAVTLPGAGDISPLWTPVSLTSVLGDVYLSIEERLYDIAINSTSKFDYSTLTPNASEQSFYDDYYEQRFLAYVAERNIQAPLTNMTYSPSNAFSWNYVNSVVSTPPTAESPDSAGAWQELYTRWYGTPYPHLEPWKLQGYVNKPTWWDAEYLNNIPSLFGGRRWKYTHLTNTGMWDNILNGIVPAGFVLPDGSVSTGIAGETTVYNYVSVNITDATISGGYTPDSLLPPYYDNSTLLSEPTVRSLFNSLSQIVSPDADYVFGDVGPTEWAWMVSSEFIYDKLIIAFLMQPVRFLQAAYGLPLTTVDQLQIDTTFCHVHTHEDALFHGDVFNTNDIYSANGLNQWYVNFNRYNGFDTNTEFRALWAGWRPKLSYQFAGIIDTESFDIFSKFFDIVPQDYNILLSNSGVFRDVWIDAFNVSVLSMPPSIIQHNNESRWKFEVDSLASINRDIGYYGVRKYPTKINIATDELVAFSHKIVELSQSAKRFTVTGNQTYLFGEGTTISVSDAGSNNGIYNVLTSVYDSTSNTTRINVIENIPSSALVGYVNKGSTLPWVTGDIVYVFSTQALPSPLEPDTPYYIIRINSTTFKLAETPNDAANNIFIDITSPGTGDVTVGEVVSNFNVFGGDSVSRDLWYHFALDKTVIRTISTPETMYSIQNFINFIDGYSSMASDMGVQFNLGTAGETDPATGRSVGWQLEIERFIDWVHNLRRTRLQLTDRYNFVVDSIIDDEMSFSGSVPAWATGQPVVITSTGTLPTPLLANTPYYFVLTSTPGTFKLSATRNPNIPGMLIDLTSSGSGTLSISQYTQQVSFPSFEVNPIRNNLWIETPQGVVSNVVTGPYADIRTSQTIFDQYGRPITPDKLVILREDLQTRVMMRPEVPNDLLPSIAGLEDPYSFLHIGGSHMFVEGYEHIVMLNDYSVGGALIYNPFLGLKSKKFDVDYYEHTEFTLRPTLGGFFLLAGQFLRNLEGSTEDSRLYYDTFIVPETRKTAARARALLGYKGTQSYFDLVNLNSKSQFLFYRGMIQAKGSVASMNAYINSRRFLDAKIDEFWAWKIAEFGDSRIKVYPRIKLVSSDADKNDVRLEFLADSEYVTDADVIESTNKGFEVVSFREKESSRWDIFPEQRTLIEHSSLFLDAAVTSRTRVYVSNVPPTDDFHLIDYWFDSSTSQLFPVEGNAIGVTPITGKHSVVGAYVYFNLGTDYDDVRVIRRTLTLTNDLKEYETEILNKVVGPALLDVNITSTSTLSVSGNITSSTPPGSLITLNGTVGNINDGAYTVLFSTYDSGTDTTSITTIEPLVFPSSQGVLMVTIGNTEFSIVNSNVIKMPLSSFTGVVLMFTLAPAVNKLSPTKIIDEKARVVVSHAPYWDPARGHHYHIAKHNIDLEHGGDPALYNQPLKTNRVGIDRGWNDTEVGTIWLDTSALAYKPYYDERIFTDVNDRLSLWGELADWSDVKVYEWVSSSVPPDEWDARSVAEESNITIPLSRRATGTTRKAVFRRTRESFAASVTPASAVITLTGHNLSVDDAVVITADTFPTTTTGEIEESVVYYVVSAIPGVSIQISDDIAGTALIMSSTGANVKVVPSFKSDDWEEYGIVRDSKYPALDSSLLTVEPTINVNGFNEGDIVSVYVNGTEFITGISVVSGTISTTGSGMVLHEADIVDIVRPIHILSDDERSFDPDVVDDGTLLVQWKEYTNYTTATRATPSGNVVQAYFFWVEGGIQRDNSDSSSLSPRQITDQLRNIPIPYVVVQKPKDDPRLSEQFGYGVPEYGSVFSIGQLAEQFYLVPVFYRQAILRGASAIIADDNRYVWKFTRDFTLRDDIDNNSRSVNLKNKHAEWLMIRQEQPDSIHPTLWNKLVEAMVGHLISDASVRVPSLERELYDTAFNTDIRFGLGEDQAFVDAVLAKNTVISYLQDPTVDFDPIDINDFFNRNTFDTIDGIEAAMNEIYLTFGSQHVNRIWFAVLNDAFSTRAKYRELMKTSWIALHGIRVLEVGGAFDD